jgi:predicted RNase H-like nuclease (RuvC/YqgF family)
MFHADPRELLQSTSGERRVTTKIQSLVAYQANQKQNTIDTIEAAKRAIESELAEHGYYPHNSGRISKLEVLRRAAVSAQTLKNATHKVTAEALDRWLRRIKKTAPTLKPQAQDAKANKIEALETRLAEVVAHYDRFKLEYNELLHRCEALETENAALKRQLAEASNVTILKFSCD